MPDGASEIHHEVELGLVIGTGTEGRNIPESAALSHIGGYVLALDMTDRVLQMKLKSTGLPWVLAKGFDTSCPVSDFIVKDKIPDPQAVDLWLKVNGKMRQEGNTKNMIFSIAFLVSWLSRHFTLERGDVILTGTPSGVGPVKVGDVIECGLGTVAKMSFPVVEGNWSGACSVCHCVNGVPWCLRNSFDDWP